MSLGTSSMPLRRICSVISKDMRIACGHSFFVAWMSDRSSSRASAADLWLHDVCSDCFSLLPAAQVRAGTLVARCTGLRQTSSTVTLPQVAGLFVHASRCTQHWPVRATLVGITFCTNDVLDDSVMDSSCVVWQLHLTVEQNFVVLFATDR